MLQIAPSTYHASKRRPPSARRLRDAELRPDILHRGSSDRLVSRTFRFSEPLCPRWTLNASSLPAQIRRAGYLEPDRLDDLHRDGSTSRNVTYWKDGEMVLGWTAAGVINAERSFRQVKGYKQLPHLVAALYRHAHPDATAAAETVSAAA